MPWPVFSIIMNWKTTGSACPVCAKGLRKIMRNLRIGVCRPILERGITKSGITARTCPCIHLSADTEERKQYWPTAWRANVWKMGNPKNMWTVVLCSASRNAVTKMLGTSRINYKSSLIIITQDFAHMLFNHLGTTVISQNLIQEKIRRRMNLGNAFYH